MTERPPLTPDIIRELSKQDAVTIAAELEEQILRQVTYERVQELLLLHRRDRQGCQFAFVVTPTRDLSQGDILRHLTQRAKDHLYALADEPIYGWRLNDAYRTTGHLFLYLIAKQSGCTLL